MKQCSFDLLLKRNFITNCLTYFRNGWTTRDVVSFSTVFQSYQDNGLVIMKDCVQPR